MPLQGPYLIDWIYSMSSSAHVAKHRDWFTNYSAFPSRTQDTGNGMEILGIGDVHLEVNAPSSSDSPAYHTLVLHDVLHVPDCLTNIVAAAYVDEFTTCRFGGGGRLEDPDSGRVLLLDRVVLHKLWLVGQPRGRTSLDPKSHYWITVGWPAEERERWEAYKRGGSGGGGTGHGATQDNSTPASLGDPQASSANGAKSKKKKKKSKSLKKEQTEPEEELIDDLSDLKVSNGTNGVDQAPAEETPNSAEPEPSKPPRYSPAEKAWQKKHYGSEFKFLMSYGLKIFKEQDRQEGERILRALMAEEPVDEGPVAVESNGVTI